MFYKLCFFFCFLFSLCSQDRSILAERIESIENLIEQYLKEEEFNNFTNLCEIMTRFGSDKGCWHNYTTLYNKLFKCVTSERLNVLELGLGTNNTDVPSNMGPNGKPGASLRGWAEYFSNSQIYGADVDKRILFVEPRIKTYFCDQNDSGTILDMYNNEDLRDLQFDIIVEDGLHEFSANLNFFRNSIGRLKDGGIFCIEDLNERAATNFEKISQDLKREFSLNFISVIRIPNDRRKDNVVLVVQK